MDTKSQIYPERISEWYISSLKSILKKNTLDPSEYSVNLTEMQDEGMGYLVKEQEYFEASNLILKKIGSDEEHSIWVGIAYVEDHMETPIMYIMNSHRTEGNRDLNTNIISPDEFLRKELSEEAYSKLKSQEYFRSNKHMALWKAN